MTDELPRKIDPDAIVDHLYEIALDPHSLETFISSWNEAGLDAGEAREAVENIDRFDQVYLAHLKRAEVFQSREKAHDTGPELLATLAPFDGLAAFIVDGDFKVVASNEGANSTFDIVNGASLKSLNLSGVMQEVLKSSLTGVFRDGEKRNCLLKIDLPDQAPPALFQIRRLPGTSRDNAQLALVVTTRYYWKAALGDTLEEVFNLTYAEQGVVRALVEGLSIKEISIERGTSEGTVRGQVKTILGKMNARSQSEVIRLVISLRDISQSPAESLDRPNTLQLLAPGDWVQREVWKPFKKLKLPDGHRMDYHDMGPATGKPILVSHMGYCMARWHRPMLQLAFEHGLRVICPIRAGYGQSDNLDPKADILQATREDTHHLLSHLGIDRLPYVTQGNDLLFAADFAAAYPEMVSEIIGICARAYLPGDHHYSSMGKWHRFFLSTAKHAPHLLSFTPKAAVSLAKRIGVVEIARRMNRSSVADLSLFEDADLASVIVANGELVAGKSADVSQAYVMEMLACETPWSDLMYKIRGIKTSFWSSDQDPFNDMAMIAEYREAYPWIDIKVMANAGQMLIYQHFNTLISKIAEAAHRANPNEGL